MCVLICVSLHVCPYMCVLICVSLHVCPYMCVLICVSLYVCPYMCAADRAVKSGSAVKRESIESIMRTSGLVLYDIRNLFFFCLVLYDIRNLYTHLRSCTQQVNFFFVLLFLFFPSYYMIYVTYIHTLDHVHNKYT